MGGSSVVSLALPALALSQCSGVRPWCGYVSALLCPSAVVFVHGVDMYLLSSVPVQWCSSMVWICICSPLSVSLKTASLAFRVSAELLSLSLSQCC